jgi:hypothetical protein
VGRFDGISPPLGVSLLTTSGRAAVTTISASRATFESYNKQLNNFFFSTVFDTTAGPRSIGEAMTRARNLVIDNESTIDNMNDMTNQDAYTLLGDPAMPLANTGLTLSIDSLPDTIKALSRLHKTGHVGTSNNASVTFQILDAAVTDTLHAAAGHPIPLSDSLDPTPVLLSPQLILGQNTSTSSGTFTLDALTPAKIDFGNFGSFRAFAIDNVTGTCGGVFIDSALQNGTDTSDITDNQGPTIRFAPCDSSYSAGEPFSSTAKIPLPFCMSVTLQDSSGISSATGPDEGTLVNLSGVWDAYRPTLKSGATYRTASFQLNFDTSKFAAGTSYQLNVLTHDQMGNYSQGSLNIQVQKSGNVGLYDVFNRPNPVKQGSSTTFYFKVTSDPDTNGVVPSTLQAAIRIHTLSGKLIRILHTDLTQDNSLRPEAVWDLRDGFGNTVANGLYPYTVLLRVPNLSGGNWTQFDQHGIVSISR